MNEMGFKKHKTLGPFAVPTIHADPPKVHYNNKRRDAKKCLDLDTFVVPNKKPRRSSAALHKLNVNRVSTT